MTPHSRSLPSVRSAGREHMALGAWPWELAHASWGQKGCPFPGELRLGLLSLLVLSGAGSTAAPRHQGHTQAVSP